MALGTFNIFPKFHQPALLLVASLELRYQIAFVKFI